MCSLFVAYIDRNLTEHAKKQWNEREKTIMEEIQGSEHAIGEYVVREKVSSQKCFSCFYYKYKNHFMK